MFQNCIQRDISGHLGTSSYTATQESLEKLVGKGTIKIPPIQTLWEGAHKMKTGIQINYGFVKI